MKKIYFEKDWEFFLTSDRNSSLVMYKYNCNLFCTWQDKEEIEKKVVSLLENLNWWDRETIKYYEKAKDNIKKAKYFTRWMIIRFFE